MALKMFLVVVVVLLTVLGNICGDERADIINTYSPSILQLRSIYSKTYQETQNQTNSLVKLISTNQQVVSKHITQRITDVRNYTATQKNKVNQSQIKLACVTSQDRIAISLRNPMGPNNITCYPTGLLNAVRSASGDFSVISALLSNTVTHCKNLNPLIPLQNDSLRVCLITKIANLNEIYGQLTINFNNITNQTLTENIQCTAKLFADLNEKIDRIIYQTRLCNP